MKKLLLSKIKKIEVLLTDVDCVLTDCGMYYDKRGDSMKKFHTRDGMAVTLLRKKRIPTIIVTKEKTIIVRKWAKRMKVYKTYDGIVDKVSILSKICKTFNVKSEQVAYIGDDVNDLELLKSVGFSAVPNDAKMKELITIYLYLSMITHPAEMYTILIGYFNILNKKILKTFH